MTFPVSGSAASGPLVRPQGSKGPDEKPSEAPTAPEGDRARFSTTPATESTANPVEAAKAALDQEITGRLDTQGQEAFSCLSLPCRDQVRSLYLGLKPESRAALLSLLSSGELLGNPLRGDGTMLDLLAKLNKPENLAPELRPDAIQGQEGRQNLQALPYLDQVVQEAADPGKIRQSEHNTCGATTVEYLVARKNPAEFVRLAADLASPSGKARLFEGKHVSRDATGSLTFDHGGRSDVDRLLQSAFMDAGKSNWFGHYNNKDDRGALAPWAPGFNPLNVDNVMYQALGEKRDLYVTPQHPASLLGKVGHFAADLVAPVSRFLPKIAEHLLDAHSTHTWDQLYDKIDASLKKGEPVPALVSFTDGKGLKDEANSLHYLAITAIDRQAGTITMRNPWGASDQGGGAGLPKREVVPGADAGTIRMTLEEFERIAHAVVPDHSD